MKLGILILRKDVNIMAENESQKSKNIENEEKSLIVQYNGSNPILKFFQKLNNSIRNYFHKIGSRNQKNEEVENNNEINSQSSNEVNLFEKDTADFYAKGFEENFVKIQKTEYEKTEKLKFSENKIDEKAKKESFVEKISGNGAYHTYEKNGNVVVVPTVINKKDQIKMTNRVKKSDDPTIETK